MCPSRAYGASEEFRSITAMNDTERQYGTAHPDKVDLIGEEGGICYLHVIQTDELDDERTLLLQTKLNNYLAFILDGQLDDEHPDKASLKKVVRVHLQHEPSGVANQFLSMVGEVFQRENVGFEYELAQQ